MGPAMDGHEAVLAWLDPVARNPSPYGFEVTDLAEGTQPGADLVSGLGEIVVRTKTRPEVLERMARALGWEDALARLRRGRESIRRGDFGEALACEILEAVDDLSVPIRKLRYQTDPEGTLFTGPMWLASNSGTMGRWRTSTSSSASFGHSET